MNFCNYSHIAVFTNFINLQSNAVFPNLLTLPFKNLQSDQEGFEYSQYYACSHTCNVPLFVHSDVRATPEYREDLFYFPADG